MTTTLLKSSCDVLDAVPPAVAPKRGLWSCRICRTVTFSVFLLILAIESIILVPSAYNFHRNALKSLEDRAAIAAMSIAFADAAMGEPDRLLPLLREARSDPAIIALRAIGADGATLAQTGDAEFSVTVGEVLNGRREKADWLAADGTRYEVAYKTHVSGRPLVFLASMDASGVRSDLVAFLLRIAGLIAIIVLVVTSGTMIVLYRSVLSPILILRRSMLDAARDPDGADEYCIRQRARDELDEVFGAHNEMLVRVAESKRADRRRAEEQTRFLTLHDPVTEMPNRKSFLETVRQMIESPGGRSDGIMIAVLRISGLTGIAEALGHQAGDRVLVEVARRVSLQAGPGECAAHFGGDCFALARPGAVDPAVDAGRAEELLSSIARPGAVGDADARLQVTAGIAYSSPGLADAETALHDAELALSRVRRDARPRYQFFAPEMMAQAKRRQEMECELRLALERGQLKLFYQPKIALGAREAGVATHACEALMRWPHREWGWVSPAEFIPLAEAAGLIGPVGEWALREACGQIRRWLDAGLDAPRVAVNLAAEQFRDPKLPDAVRSALAAHRVEPERLELEITESTAMEDVELTTAVLSALRRLGVELSIDDFGTGYSSLSYLRRFDVDSIKIDKSFVDDIGRDSNADAICDAIIRLGHSLGKRIVAEGVETEMQAEFLRQRRCEEAQGFLYARPMTADDLAQRLASLAGETVL